MKALTKAMIIDDDELNNYICSKIITLTGFARDTVDFTNASKALEHLNKTMNENPDELPQIIFLDLTMPGTNGWAFLKEYEKLDKTYKDKIYLSILTTSVFDADRELAGAFTDVNNFLSKPLSADELSRISNEINS